MVVKEVVEGPAPPTHLTTLGKGVKLQRERERERERERGESQRTHTRGDPLCKMVRTYIQGQVTTDIGLYMSLCMYKYITKVKRLEVHCSEEMHVRVLALSWGIKFSWSVFRV